jgi:hypothetical protein
MSKGGWVKELPAEIMVCDTVGLILEMNAQAEALFAEDGGRDLLGTNILGCHPDPAHGKLERILEEQTANTYSIPKTARNVSSSTRRGTKTTCMLDSSKSLLECRKKFRISSVIRLWSRL